MSTINAAFRQYADLYREVEAVRPATPFMRRINQAGAEAFGAAAEAFRRDPMGIPETGADRLLVVFILAETALSSLSRRTLS